MAFRLQALPYLLALSAGLAAGCFDSDQKFRVDPSTTGGDDTTSTTVPATTSPATTEPASTTTGPPPEVTCRDAVECIRECALDLILNPVPEPDLSCFLDCVEETGLTEREAYDLLRLANCASEQCAAVEGVCAQDEATSTGTGTGTGTGTTTSGGDGGNNALDPCLQCIFLRMQDQEAEGCEEFQAACE